MGTWIEIRCEAQKPPRSHHNRCWSFDNSGPHGMASDTQEAILRAVRDLNREAARTGWKRTRDGWVCPHCK